MPKLTSSSDLKRRLGGTLLEQRLVALLAGIFITAGVIILAIASLSLVAAVAIVPVWLKMSLLSVSSVVVGYFLIRFALVRVLGGSIDSVAVELERQYPDLKGRLIAALQFARQDANPGYSTELMDQTISQAINKSETINFREAVSFFQVWRSLRVLAISALLALALLVVAPGLYQTSYNVYSHPTTEIAPPLGYRVVAVPGSSECVKYRDISIGAAIFGDDLPEQASIYHRLVGGSWQREDIDLALLRTHTMSHADPTASGDTVALGNMVAFGDSIAVAVTLRQINKSFDYYVEAGRVRTDLQKIDVVDRPRITGIKLSLIYPDYTGLSPEVIDENNGSFSAIVGTRVSMRVEINLPVETAELVFLDTTTGVQSMEVDGKFAETGILVDESNSYHLRLVDHLGEQNPDPIEYRITAIPDEYPSLDVLRPGFDVNLGDEMVLPLKVRMFDDFGFTSLVLKYSVVNHGRQSEEHVAVLHFSERIKTEGDVEFNWDMDALNLYPGDYVVYFLEVADNDAVSGPKTTRSRQYVARLPSLDEIIAETEAETSNRIVKTEDLLKAGRELQDRLKQADRKLQAQTKQARQADWQQRKELEAIADKNQEIVDNLQKMSEDLQKSVDKMGDKSLTSREILEKLAQIRKLFEDIATPEMKEAQKKLMEALQKMNRNEIQKALEDFQMTQEELLKRLERTLALLKKMQLEQQMEALVRMAEELVKRQEGVNKATDSTQKSSLPSLSPSEDDIKAGLDELKEKTKALEELAKQAEVDQSPEMQQFSDAVEKTDADQDMQEMSQSLQQENKPQASSSGKQALSKLMQMMDDMQQSLLAMKGGDQEKIKKAMRMALDDANYLSKRQEYLFEQTQPLDTGLLMLHEMAEMQQAMANSCSGLKKRISDLGKESPFMASELEKLVGDAVQNMELAVDELEARKRSKSNICQRQAMAQLNKASVRLMESIKQQSECDKGGNCDKNMSKMQSMCNKQNKLNQQTKGQCNKPGNKQCNSPKPGSGQPQFGEGGEGGQYQRLAAEQGALRKSMEQLADEFGGSRQILGRLDDIAREMKQVEEALEEGDVGQQTLERQLSIYSRMLQATRSLQRRDYSERRKAAAATDQPAWVPPALPAELLDDRVKLEDRLRKYLSDDYPPQYEQHIKAYFKALLQIEARYREAGGEVIPTP